jgi:S1-C subfamily serine protease
VTEIFITRDANQESHARGKRPDRSVAVGGGGVHPSRVMRAFAAVLGSALLALSGEARAQPRAQLPTTVTGLGASARPRLARATVNVRDGASDRGRGVVLADDGRIFTALAAVQGAQNPRVVYPDGRVDRVRVVATDTAWGVALLEGFAGRWPEGVPLANGDGRSRDNVGWIPSAGARPTAGTLARRRSFVGSGGALLRDAWELNPIPASSAAGSGVASEENGALVALLVPPPRDAEITGPEFVFGVPASVLRAVQSRAVTVARPWLGVVAREIRMGEDAVLGATGGLRVTEIHANSPAAIAGVRAGPQGDVIVSVDGHPVTTLADLGAVLQARRVGDTITMQVMRRNSRLDLSVLLTAMPTAHGPGGHDAENGREQ